MTNAYLATYLNDHLAGATAGLELLAHLEKSHTGDELGATFAQLHREIGEDREELVGLMKRLDIAASAARRLTGWCAEKMTELKLRLDDPGRGPLRLLEEVEALAVGVDGKRCLWRALGTAAEQAAPLRQLDYQRLERRALQQRERLESIRLEAARKALAGNGST